MCVVDDVVEVRPELSPNCQNQDSIVPSGSTLAVESNDTVSGVLPASVSAPMAATGGMLSGGSTITLMELVALEPPSSVTVSWAVKTPPVV